MVSEYPKMFKHPISTWSIHCFNILIRLDSGSLFNMTKNGTSAKSQVKMCILWTIKSHIKQLYLV